MDYNSFSRLETNPNKKGKSKSLNREKKNPKLNRKLTKTS
jgi:hypothetical protein